MSDYLEKLDNARQMVRTVDPKGEYFSGIRIGSGEVVGIKMTVPTPGPGTVIAAYFHPQNNTKLGLDPKNKETLAFEAIFNMMIIHFEDLINLRLSHKKFMLDCTGKSLKNRGVFE